MQRDRWRDCNASRFADPRSPFTEPFREKPPFRLVADKLERLLIAACRRRVGPAAAQQIGPRGMEQVIVFEIAGQGVDQREAGLGALHHRDGYGPIERHNRGRLHPLEQIVQADDLCPVGVFGPSRPAMLGREGCLQGERPYLATQRFIDQRQRLGNLIVVPPAPILFVEKDQIAGGVEPRRSP